MIILIFFFFKKKLKNSLKPTIPDFVPYKTCKVLLNKNKNNNNNNNNNMNTGPDSDIC